MSSTTCKSTYWDKDHDTQEWTELSCTQPGRHSNHRSGERFGLENLRLEYRASESGEDHGR